HLLSVATEHRAVLDPLESLSKQNYSVDILSVNELGELDLEELEKKIQKSTKIVSIMLANNEIGTIHPIEKISKICKQKSVLLHCDATQALGRIKIDVNTLGVDLLSISAHKCYGPKGVGALFVRPRVVLAPQIEGGGHERDLRSGTLNTLGISGFGVAAELADTLQATDAEQLNRLSARLMKQLEDELGEIILNGSSTKRLPGSINISIPSISNERLLAKIQTKLAFSLASACQSAKKEPSHVLSALGIEKSRISSSIRLSIGRYSTENEIDRAANILTKAVKQLRQKT
ncbi:UNVERIFIED_CONTAM: hypothetical protein GTU68_052031, partial [Idotea baltica]|nr:hypothetical protein [Idotea baltica]